MKNKNQGKLLTIALGIILVISAAVLAYLTVTTRPPKLSEEKMQQAAKAAEAVKKQKNTQPEESKVEEPHTKSIKAFQVTSGNPSGSGAAEGQPKDAEGSKDTDKEDFEDEGEEDLDNGYLCTYSSERQMTETDIQELKQGTYTDLPQGKGIIRMVVNELYAKYGYQFGNEDIQAYFNQKEWYQDIPTRSTDMNDIIKKMTDTERANVEFLSPYIEEE